MFDLFRPRELRPTGGHPVASARDPAKGRDDLRRTRRTNVVVAGVGSAGAAPAARFTKSGRLTVRLFDAGSPAKDANRRIPTAFSTLFRSGTTGAMSPHLSSTWAAGRSTGRAGIRRVVQPQRDGVGARTTTSGPSWPGAGGRGTGLRPSRLKVERATGSTDTDHRFAGAVTIDGPPRPRAPAHPHRFARETFVPVGTTAAAGQVGDVPQRRQRCRSSASRDRSGPG